MAERITYSADFKKKMIEFYKDNPEAKHKQAEEHAKGLGLGYETISDFATLNWPLLIV
jgi:hypothetical protein